MDNREDENRESYARRGIWHPLYSTPSYTMHASTGIQQASGQFNAVPVNTGVSGPSHLLPRINPPNRTSQNRLDPSTPQLGFTASTSEHNPWRHQDGSERKCAKCNQEFSHKSDSESYQCCDEPESLESGPRQENVANEAGSGIHSMTNLERRLFRCDICRKEFRVERDLQQHECQDWTCEGYPFCPEKFSDPSALREHVKIHNARKVFKCDKCKKGFDLKGSLILHLRIHSGEKPFPCHLCPKKFARRSTLAIHHRTHTGEQLYQCEFCPKKFSQKSILDVHRRTHTGEKPFQCEFCPKKFSQKHVLDSHRRTHTGEKPYQCKYCSEKFARKMSRDRHYRTHTGEKPHQCEFCPKNFSQKHVLDSHRRTHTGEKPFHCEFCSKNFSKKSRLVEHQLTHTGEKAYQCHLCSEKFRYHWSLKWHFQKNHSDEKELYRCDICKEDFTNNAEHLKRHHRIHEPKSPNNDAEEC